MDPNGWRPKVVLAQVGLTNKNDRVRLSSYALNYLSGLAETSVSWCAMASPRGTPNLSVPVVVRLGPGIWTDPVKYVDHYRWRGLPVDPFLTTPGADSKLTLRGPDDLGGLDQFSRHPFTTRFLNRYDMGTRTVIYLRDRGSVEAVIALDRKVGLPDIGASERVALLRVAPMLGQMITCAVRTSDPVSSPGPRVRSTLEPLTKREEQIARMVGRGLSNDDVAQELALSTGTVKVHVGHIYRKAGVRTRADLVRLILSQADSLPDDRHSVKHG